MRMNLGNNNKERDESTIVDDPDHHRNKPKGLFQKLRADHHRATPMASLRRRMRRRKAADAEHETETATTTTVATQDEMRDEPPPPPPTKIRTSILSSYHQPNNHPVMPERPVESITTTRNSSCSTAILQHSFVLCGNVDDTLEDNAIAAADPRVSTLSEDPTVQESFECVFASQLEEGLPMEVMWEEESVPKWTLTSPAVLHQSLSKTRLHNTPTISESKKSFKKSFKTGTLLHLGTYDPVSDYMCTSNPANACHSVAAAAPVVTQPCHCTKGNRAPLMYPKDWPQRPLLFRPTPGSGMRVKSVRLSSGIPLWQRGDSSHNWIQSLHTHWGRPRPDYQDLGCEECMILPINNGNEKTGESLVVDFSAPLFEGSILLRLRHANGSTPQPYDDDRGYFCGVNRRYQVVIQGRPLRELPVTELMTGFELERPCGKLPAKWMLNSALKLVSFFAPQLEAKLDGPNPISVSPLGSTPQSLRINGQVDLEHRQEEPTAAKETLMGIASDAPTTLARARFRKKAFDKLYQAQDKQLVMVPSNTYTFEFLQHLLNFTNFTVELGSMMGSIPLKEMLDGQPLQVMAQNMEKEKLWAFDVLHEDLYDDAKKHDDDNQCRMGAVL